MFAGYFGGWLADAIMRLTDVFLAVPQLILALALAQLMSPSLETAMIALTLTYWPFFARTVYAETRRLRVSVFVEALQGLGAGNMRIMFLHVLPNAASPIIVRATIGMGFTILTAAVLGFLGMGATPPEPDWGLAIAESRQYLPEAWWFATFPGLRSSPPCSASTCSATACATSSIRACGARAEHGRPITPFWRCAISRSRSAAERARRRSWTTSI